MAGGARARPDGDRARARDRAHPADRGRFVERFGDTVAILHSQLSARERFDEWSRLRSGARGLRRPPLGGLRPAGQRGPDRGRRGARRLLQAGGRPPLRRPPRGRAARAGRVAPCCWPAAPRRGPRPCSATAGSSCASAWTAAACRRSSWWAWRASGARCTRARATPSSESAGSGEKAIVLLNRRGWSNFLACGECGRVWDCPSCDVTLVLHRGPGGCRATTAGTPSRCRVAAPTAARCRCRATGSARSSWGPSSSELVSPLPVFRLDADTAPRRRGGGHARALRPRRAGRPGGHADGGQGPRLPRRDARAWCSTPTPRCGSPTSAPRSAPSRWWRSWRGAAAAASAAGG